MSEQIHANPSRDPANDDSMLGMAKQVLDKFLNNIDDMLPARVVSYDRASNRASVVPMISLLTTDGRQVPRAQIASVPVMQVGGDKVALTFNLKPGDLGWIKANDRDTSVLLRGYQEGPPPTLRKHSFQDAVFIPDVMRGFTIPAEDLEHATLQTQDGKYRVSIWPDRVKITSDTRTVEIGPTNITLTNGAAVLTMTPTDSTFAGHVAFPNGVSIRGIDY